MCLKSELPFPAETGRGVHMSGAFVKIDLHGLRQEEAMKVIDRAIASAGPATYQLQLIHGYNRGRTRSSGPRFCADRSGA